MSTNPGTHQLLAAFPIVVETDVRWGEMDAFGHVNNVHFFRYFEIARVAYFEAIGFREGRRIGPILAHTSCRFRRPLHYPDRVLVGVRTRDLSEDRFVHEYTLVSKGLDSVAATGEGIIISYDYHQGAKAPLPKEIVERIRDLEAMKRHVPKL